MEQKQINKLVHRFTVLERDIERRTNAIQKINDDFDNWYGVEGYTHYLKAGPQKRIDAHEVGIDKAIKEMNSITKQLTYQQFMSAYEKKLGKPRHQMHEGEYIAEDDHTWLGE
ncbi:hypothetical protein [Pseudoalteromonas rubra]|uniref:hypothetical protein n=1 Tax=Pseudoalteromonas rubra TaxID=43658 RepID=UPI002DB6F00C|nr:hypothetical protein [Pseudoalteromonas rubra]MEC4091609.1 hypothetical protein [Pseudoalteromonas rubra]